MMTDKGSWGFRRNMRIADIESIESLIGKLAKTIRYTTHDPGTFSAKFCLSTMLFYQFSTILKILMYV